MMSQFVHMCYFFSHKFFFPHVLCVPHFFLHGVPLLGTYLCLADVFSNLSLIIANHDFLVHCHIHALILPTFSHVYHVFTMCFKLCPIFCRCISNFYASHIFQHGFLFAYNYFPYFHHRYPIFNSHVMVVQRDKGTKYGNFTRNLRTSCGLHPAKPACFLLYNIYIYSTM